MTKLDWEKADVPNPDPGAVVAVPDVTQPDRWVPPQEQARRRQETAEAEAERRERFRRINWAVRFEPRGQELERLEQAGQALDRWGKLLLEKWREVRAIFPEYKERPTGAP